MREIILRVAFEDHDLVTIDAGIGNLTVTILAEASLDGRALILRGTHFDGPGPNTLGIATLREIANRIAEIADVETVVVEGAIRTTGAAPGRKPRALRFARPTRAGPA